MKDTKCRMLETIELTAFGNLAKLPNMRRLDGDTKRRLEAQAQVVKALAHPTRLFLVEELSKKEYCVCELTEMVGADISTVSKHLSMLRAAGIVQRDKRGQQVFYHLQMPCALDFFSCASAVLVGNATQSLEAVTDSI